MSSPQAQAVRPPQLTQAALRELITQGREAAGEEVLDTLSQQAVERFEPGERIPGTNYWVHSFLGEGESAVVYGVENRQIQRRAAVKILRSSLSSSAGALLRFRDAARAVNQIGSPYIVGVFDFAKLRDGRVLLAMDLLKGTTLAAALERGPIRPARTIPILRQLCKALAAAHKADVVHGNVEPGNIMLVAAGPRRDGVKLLSFAVAAAVTGGPLAGSPPTPPQFPAPERSSDTDVDRRSDVFAVGCTAYQMLTGRPAFEPGDSAMPPPPSTVGDCPAALDDVVMRCLAEDPADRYQDMPELEAALCEAQIAAKIVTPWDGLPPPAVAPPRRDRLAAALQNRRGTARSRARRLVWPAIGLAIALFGTGINLAFDGGGDVPVEIDSELPIMSEAGAALAKAHVVEPPPDDPTPTMESSRVRAPRPATRAHAQAEPSPPTEADAGPDTPEAPPRLRPPLAAKTVADKRKVLAMLEAYLETGELDPAEAELVRSLIAVLRKETAHRPREPGAQRASAEKPPARDPKLAAAHIKQARKLVRRGRYREAEALFHRALAADHRNRRALAGLAEVHFERSNYGKAVKYAERSVSAAPNNRNYRMRLGDALFKVFRYRDAERHYTRAKELGHPQAATALDNVRRRLGK